MLAEGRGHAGANKQDRHADQWNAPGRPDVCSGRLRWRFEMPIPRNMPVRRAKARARAESSEIDSFGAWISFLVVFATVMAVIVVWQNFNDHAYSLATGAHPHLVTSALAAK
jgi:hypothetical protein